MASYVPYLSAQVVCGVGTGGPQAAASPTAEGKQMTIALQKVSYSVDSKYGTVQQCLKMKKKVVAETDGIGSQSCCCFISFLTPSGQSDTIFGNSRIKVPYQVAEVGKGASKYDEVKTACVHGELTALWNLLEGGDALPTILEMYIEMSPCAKCKPALDNILQDGQQVLYSFDHPGQVSEWQAAANHLCK